MRSPIGKPSHLPMNSLCASQPELPVTTQIIGRTKAFFIFYSVLFSHKTQSFASIPDNKLCFRYAQHNNNNMTWSAFYAAFKTGLQTRALGLRQGVNRAASSQQTKQRAAVSTQAANKVKEGDIDFLVLDVSWWWWLWRWLVLGTS